MAITGIKHIAFAVADVHTALKQFQAALGLGEGVTVRQSAVANQRSCSFMVGNVQYQLIQGLDPDGRYATHVARHGESINHICYTVDNLRETVDQALAEGATLREQTCRLSDDPEEIARWKATVGPESVCRNCGIVGQYEHPEGWVCFLEQSDVPGTGVELMQVYKPEEIPAQYRKGPLDL